MSTPDPTPDTNPHWPPKDQGRPVLDFSPDSSSLRFDIPLDAGAVIDHGQLRELVGRHAIITNFSKTPGCLSVDMALVPDPRLPDPDRIKPSHAKIIRGIVAGFSVVFVLMILGIALVATLLVHLGMELANQTQLLQELVQ